jgi:hypothetical protein
MTNKFIKLVQIDGKLPNLALMRLSSYYKNKGYGVDFTRSVNTDLFDKKYKYIFASSIFQFSINRINKLKKNYPTAIIGGTGTQNWQLKTEDYIGNFYELDYSLYPDVDFSIGFSQRGCRLKCKFCVVPTKEGKNVSNDSIHKIWRGNPYPKNIILLDNDFFGQPREDWKSKIKEIQDGKFKINLNQGINIRLIDEEAAENLAQIDYRDLNFKSKRIYTAWDNIGDEKRFFKGIDLLVKYGIKPSHIVSYMLIGYDKRETWDRIWYRFNKMKDYGIFPYPMVYDPLGEKKKLKQFQRYVVRRYFEHKTWEEYLDFMQGNKRVKNLKQEEMFYA